MSEAGLGPDPRHEHKLKLPAGSAAHVGSVLGCLRQRFRSPFPARAVNTVYFDTPRLRCFAASVDGAFARYKLRLRWYGPEDPREVFVEWKSRRGSVGFKRRFPISWSGPLAGRDWSEVRDRLQAAVPAGLRPSFAVTCLPTLFHRYRRTYLESGDRRCRVTVDEGLGYRKPPGVRTVCLEPLIRRHGVIVEVKVSPSDRQLAAAVLQALRLRPQRSSKYTDTLGGL